MTARRDGDLIETTDRIASVDIDRLILRNVGLAGHDARALVASISAALHDGGSPRRTPHTTPLVLRDIARAVADRVRAEIVRPAPNRQPRGGE